MRRARLQLQEVETSPPEPDDDVLAKISDPVARELYRKKLDLGIQGRTFVGLDHPRYRKDQDA